VRAGRAAPSEALTPRLSIVWEQTSSFGRPPTCAEAGLRAALAMAAMCSGVFAAADRRQY